MLIQDAERWLSDEEIAAHLGISKETVYRWLEKQKNPALLVGRLWKFKAREVDQLTAAGRAEVYSSEQGEQN